jgi:hypothetical protein
MPDHIISSRSHSRAAPPGVLGMSAIVPPSVGSLVGRDHYRYKSEVSNFYPVAKETFESLTSRLILRAYDDGEASAKPPLAAINLDSPSPITR